MSSTFSPDIERAALSKARLRILPLLFAVYVVAYIDRINVSFAAPGMNADLGLTASAYGLGAGIFFVGYFVVEVPSNMALEKFGARIWIFRIMATWGIVAACMALVRGESSLYVVRFLLGVAEAGLFPGVILYLTYWFPRESRTRAVAWFMTAIPIAGVISAPLSGVLIDFGDGWLGMQGWQTMFVVEGIAAVVMAFVVLALLPDSPARASWLSTDERSWFAEKMRAEDQEKPEQRTGFAQTLASPRVWGFTAVYFLFSAAIYGITLWLGIILADTSTSSPLKLGLLGAIPYLVAAVVMVAWATHSELTGERRWHAVGGAALATVGFLLTGLGAGSTAYQIIALAIAASGILSALSTFWSLPTTYLTAAMAAVGIAIINSVGNLGGFLGPYAVGVLHDATGRYYDGMLLLAVCAALGGLLLWFLSRPRASGSAPMPTPDGHGGAEL